MKTQSLDNSITFKGFVIACIILIPHCVYSFYKIVFRKKYFDIPQTRNTFLFLIQLISSMLEFVMVLQLAILILPIYALFDIYMLTVSYSQLSFVEATEDVFINVVDAISKLFNSQDTED